MPRSVVNTIGFTLIMLHIERSAQLEASTPGSANAEPRERRLLSFNIAADRNHIPRHAITPHESPRCYRSDTPSSDAVIQALSATRYFPPDDVIHEVPPPPTHGLTACNSVTAASAHMAMRLHPSAATRTPSRASTRETRGRRLH